MAVVPIATRKSRPSGYTAIAIAHCQWAQPCLEFICSNGLEFSRSDRPRYRLPMQRLALCRIALFQGQSEMGEYSTIRVTHEGPVDWLTLDRPDRLNALDATMVRELWDYFDRLQSDYSRRVVILRGSGRGFCAGLDLNWYASTTEGMPKGATETGPGPSLADIVLKMRSCPQVIVALVHGAACGGGFAFVLAADIRIAGRSARMNAAFVRLGLSGCELGTSYFLPRLVGAATAAELLMTGRFLHADRALATGLVTEVVDDEELETTARALLNDLLATSPMGLRKTKETLLQTAQIDDLAAVIALEERVQMACIDAGHFAPALKPHPVVGG